MQWRISRLAVLCLLSLTASVALAQAGPFRYAAGSERYRVTTVVKRSQLQGGGRAPFDFETTTKQLVTLNLAPRSRDTLRLTVTVDSVGVTSTLAAPQPNLRHLFGAKLTGTISPQGRVYSFQPTSTSADSETAAQTAALYAAFRRFLLSLPPRALEAGSSWADTTTDAVKREGFAITTTTVTTSRVTGDTVLAGQRAWRVERHAEVAQTGTGTEAGQPIQMTGTGTINGVHYVSPTGVYLGSQSTQTSDITMSTKDSEGAPISQTIKSTVELIPPVHSRR